MSEQLERRLAALEQAVTDGDGDCAALAEGAVKAERIDDIEDRIDDLADSVAELEAATQALRGYVGNVRSVNSEVEQRADVALSRVESLESNRRCERCGQETSRGTGETRCSERRTGTSDGGGRTGTSGSARASDGGVSDYTAKAAGSPSVTDRAKPGRSESATTAANGPGATDSDGTASGTGPLKRLQEML